MTVKIIHISKESLGQRIDNFLLTALKGVPKSRIYKALRKGEVRVNKGRVQPTYRLQEGDAVRIPPIRVAERDQVAVPESLRNVLLNAILYEDEHCLVLDKPADLAVHGGSKVKFGLIEALRQIDHQYEQADLVHRLDRGTSGCLLVAKNRVGLLSLQAQLNATRMVKIYTLVVHGQWPFGVTTVDFPLKKIKRGGEHIVVVDSEGRCAKTEFSIVRQSSEFTVLQARLITGRMHQIRVHAKAVGCPIVGDTKYGDKNRDAYLIGRGVANRLFLHAKTLSFYDMTEHLVTVEAARPSAFSWF